MVIYKEPRSLPLSLCVTMQNLDGFRVALLTPDRVFHTVDSSSEIGESDGACGTIEDSRWSSP